MNYKINYRYLSNLQMNEKTLKCQLCEILVNIDFYNDHFIACKIKHSEIECELCYESLPDVNDVNYNMRHYFENHSFNELKLLGHIKLEGYDSLITTSNKQSSYNLFKCKLCRNLIPNINENLKLHMIKFHRATKFNNYLEFFHKNFNFISNENHCVCNLCGVFFVNNMLFIDIHLKTVHNQNIRADLNFFAKFFCNLCDNTVEMTNHNHYSFMTLVKQNMELLDNKINNQKQSNHLEIYQSYLNKELEFNLVKSKISEKLKIDNSYTNKTKIQNEWENLFEDFKLCYDEGLNNINYSYSHFDTKFSEKLKLQINLELIKFNEMFKCDENSSIFLIVDKNNLQIMKLLISGLRGTPFQHGLYEFDIFIPEDYPMSEPLITCRTSLINKVYLCPSLPSFGTVYYKNTLFSNSKKNDLADNLSLTDLISNLQKILSFEKDIYDIKNNELDLFENEGYINILRYINLQYGLINAYKNTSPCFKCVIDFYFKNKKPLILEEIIKTFEMTNIKGYKFEGDFIVKEYPELVVRFKELGYFNETKVLINSLSNLN